MKGLSRSRSTWLAALAALPLLAIAAPAHAFSLGDWWLPDVHSEHGPAIDRLFIWIFAITVAALVLVQVTMVVFLIKYRHRSGATRAHFIHGNTRLEMVWTLIPAAILGIIALASKSVWGEYRYNSEADADRVQIMVVGEQFKWNVIYPGPDGKIGKYLDYPKISDAKYRRYPRKEALSKIAQDMSENHLGQRKGDPEFRDPKTGNDFGEDDDWDPTPGGRPICIPMNKTIEVLLSSKDVLHDFFLPNFRVKLDAVPGMIGHIYFKPVGEGTQSTREVPIASMNDHDYIWVDMDTPHATAGADEGTYVIKDPKNADIVINRLDRLTTLAQKRLIKANPNKTATAADIAAEVSNIRKDFAAAGIDKLTIAHPWELVCEELCGQGHGTMRGEVIILSQQQWDNFIFKNSPKAQRQGKQLLPMPSTQPSQPRNIALAR